MQNTELLTNLFVKHTEWVGAVPERPREVPFFWIGEENTHRRRPGGLVTEFLAQTKGRREKERKRKRKGKEKGKGKLEVKLWQKRKKSQQKQNSQRELTLAWPAMAAELVSLRTEKFSHFSPAEKEKKLIAEVVCLNVHQQPQTSAAAFLAGNRRRHTTRHT